MKRVGGEGVDYSIWNPKTLTYDYYRAPTALREGVIAPKPKLGSGGRLGLAPEQAARALPAGAVKAGSGATARGMIAHNGGMGDFVTGDTTKVVMLLASAYLLYRYVWKPV